MSFSTLLRILGPPVATALAVALAIVLAAWAILRKRRERWQPALMPIALAAAFIAGFLAGSGPQSATQFSFPATWHDESWKFIAIVAPLAGLLLAIARPLPAKWSWLLIVLLAAAASWLTVHRFPSDRTYFFTATTAAILLYAAALRPASQDRRLAPLGPALILLSSAAATALIMPADMRTGVLLVMLTALAGLSLVTALLPFLRAIATGAALFLAVLFASLTTLSIFYETPDVYPPWIFTLFAAAPLTAALAWLPPLRRRPILCTVLALAAATAILAPALIAGLRDIPPIK